MRIEGHTAAAPTPAAPLSQSVRIEGIIAASGQVAFHPQTGELVSEGVEDQTLQALLNLSEVLKASGASLDDVIRVGVFLTDPGDFRAMNNVYSDFFAKPYPARTTVFVGLPNGIKVEIDAIAVKPSSDVS